MASNAAFSVMNEVGTGSITARNVIFESTPLGFYNGVSIGNDPTIAIMETDHPHNPSNIGKLNALGFSSPVIQATFNTTHLRDVISSGELTKRTISNVTAGYTIVVDRDDGIKALFIGAKGLEDLVDKVYSFDMNETTNGLDKRDYYVDWASLSFDNANHDISARWWADRETFQFYEGLNDMTSAENWLSSHIGQKLCVGAYDAKNQGDMSTHLLYENTAFHGELYWNVYGGIDGFCNDYNKDTNDST